MFYSQKFPIILQRFAQEGGEGSASQSNVANNNVTENGGTDGQTASVKDRQKQYESMKEQLRDLYDADVQNQIKRRLPDYEKIKREKSEYERFKRERTEQDELISLLNTRYKTNTIKDLKSAIEADDGYWQDAADRADMSVEQYKQHIKLQNEANRDKAELNTLRREKEARQQYYDWLRQAEEVKKVYPDFDLNTALKDSRFRAMLSVKNPEYMPSMTEIYRMLNHDEIMSSVQQQTTKGITDTIRARGQRPDEAGSDKQTGGIDYTRNVSSLSKAQRADLAKRAAMGEIITFK